MAIIELTWQNSNSSAEGFRVYRSLNPIDPSDPPAAIATLPAGSTNYSDDSAAENTLYYYRVSAYLYGSEVFSEQISASSATGWTPADIFNASDGLWFEIADRSTLFQDTWGQTPVTAAGQTVALVVDKSGNNRHAYQTSETARPTYQTDGTYHWIEFDGNDSLLLINPLRGNNGLVVSAAVRSPPEFGSVGAGWNMGRFLAGSYIVESGGNKGIDVTLGFGGAGVAWYVEPAGPDFIATLPVSVSTDIIVTGVTSVADGIIVRANGVASENAGPGTDGALVQAIGHHASSTYFTGGRLYGILMQSAPPVSETIALMEAWLGKLNGSM